MNMMEIDMKSVVMRSIKYMIEGVVVALVAHVIPQKKLNVEEVLMISVSAAFTFAILDLFAPEMAGHARMGTGFGVGFHKLAQPEVYARK